MVIKDRIDFKPLLNFKKNWMQICGLVFLLAGLVWAFFDHTVASMMAVGFFFLIVRDILHWIKVWK